MKKLRVLRIMGECKIGGVETIALNYYKNINHDKISMDFLFYGESHEKFSNELKKHGDKVYNVTDYRDGMIKSIKEIKNIVKQGNYDIVHSQLNALNFFPLLGAKLGGCKVRIASNHSTANLKYEFKKSVIKYLLRPTCGMLATDYASCSEYAGKWAFGKRKQRSGKIKVIHNAIKIDKFLYNKKTRKQKRKELNLENKFVIGHAGRFVEQKNHKFIIDIFNEIKKIKKNSVLLLIGNGELEGKIKNYVKEKGLEDSVYFLGIRFDVNELMQAMDVFLFPSIYEGLGNVVTEAQAASLQVIASDVVPTEVKMTEYVEFMSLKDSAKKWAEHVTKYSNEYIRRNTYHDLKINGYEIKSAAEDLLEYYQNLL